VQSGAGLLRQAHLKTHESNRSVAVPRFAAEVIGRRLTRIDAEDGEHLLFLTRNGKPLGPHNVRRTFREILRNAGLEGMGTAPHAFRRTGATLLANELGMQAAADVLGHLDVDDKGALRGARPRGKTRAGDGAAAAGAALVDNLVRIAPGHRAPCRNR
jgi:integrase